MKDVLNGMVYTTLNFLGLWEARDDLFYYIQESLSGRKGVFDGHYWGVTYCPQKSYYFLLCFQTQFIHGLYELHCDCEYHYKHIKYHFSQGVFFEVFIYDFFYIPESSNIFV